MKSVTVVRTTDHDANANDNIETIHDFMVSFSSNESKKKVNTFRDIQWSSKKNFPTFIMRIARDSFVQAVIALLLAR